MARSVLENWLQTWQSSWSSCWGTALGLRWILLFVWEENTSVHQFLLIKREAMWPILNLDCLFKMQIPENKESDCTWHWKLGAQLWARLLCTELQCSIDQSRQQHFSYLGTVVVPLLTFYLKRQRKKPSGVVQKPAQSLLWIYFYRKTANLMGITWSCWTHWILHKEGCFIILADNKSAAPSRLIFSVRI